MADMLYTEVTIIFSNETHILLRNNHQYDHNLSNTEFHTTIKEQIIRVWKIQLPFLIVTTELPEINEWYGINDELRVFIYQRLLHYYLKIFALIFKFL